MTYRGTVKDGFVVLDGPEKPPEGAKVDVLLSPGSSEPDGGTAEQDTEQSDQERVKRLNEFLLKLAETSKQVLPTDASRNVDHYLYGHPKR